MRINNTTLLVGGLIFLVLVLTTHFSATAQNESIPNINYVPGEQSVDLWISEALTLGDEIAKNGNASVKQKAKRFNEVVGILIVVGNTYPEYKEYYRDILLKDNSTKKKVLIASILGALHDKFLSDILLELLEDDDPANRMAAILYYQDIRDDQALPKLEYISKNDPDIRIKIMAAHVFRTIKSSGYDHSAVKE